MNNTRHIGTNREKKINRRNDVSTVQSQTQSPRAQAKPESKAGRQASSSVSPPLVRHDGWTRKATRADPEGASTQEPRQAASRAKGQAASKSTNGITSQCGKIHWQTTYGRGPAVRTRVHKYEGVASHDRVTSRIARRRRTAHRNAEPKNAIISKG
jgi:hypothetical protein